ncbi:HAD family hydrolase [Candidatus Pacearchaeota archaeon]|nr:hypothetical protein [uncultured archaeon]AQS31833.1 hypothetical protein [uncultured archaeon]MBS3088529.1 HAD family hydrolase [Candidatus Pacearchaeota archaeon]
MIKLIIFDFDGTLVDTKEMIFKIIKDTFNKFNYQITSALIKEHLGNSPIRGTLKHLGINQKHIESVVSHSNAQTIKLSKKIKQAESLLVLKKLKQNKIILSNNVSQFINAVLENLGITFFDKVYGAEDFETKEQKIKQIMKKEKLFPNEIIYVGDKTVDVDVARSVRCVSVIISHKASWSTRKEVAAKHPDFIIKDFSELPKIVNELN